MVSLPLILFAWALPGILSEDPRLAEARTLEASFPADLGDWERRSSELRRRVRVAAGIWPARPKVDLWPAVVHGAVEREGYVVERVYLESLPGFHVTGNLYRPTTPGPHPGVLSPHGHWTDGRFSRISDQECVDQIEAGQETRFANARYHLQARCATLARMGCVVFHYDMLGYADSRQLPHDGGFGDAQAEQWGLSPFGLQTWNSLAALDFLAGRPDVDPARLAVSGASGGGTQTFVLGAVDPRPAILFPAVMVSTGMQGGCSCENASYLRIDAGNVDFAALAAPRTLALTGADDWTIRLEEDALPDLRRLYGSLGADDRVHGWCYRDHPHNYNLVAREHLYDLLAREFELSRFEEEPELVPLDPDRLSVYGDGYPRPGGGRTEVRAALLELFHAEAERLRELAAEEPAEFRRVVGGALEVMVSPRGGADASWWPGMGELLEARSLARVRGTGSGSAPLDFVELEDPPADRGHSGPRLVTSAVGDPRRVVLEVLWDAAGRPSLVLEPLLGDDPQARLPVDEGRHGQHVAFTWGYNRTLIAERAGDLLATLRLAAGAGDVALYGGGDAAAATVLAAALGGELPLRVAVEWPAHFDDLDDLTHGDFLPRAQRFGGLESFAALIAPTPLLLLGIDEVPGTVLAAYQAAGVPGAVEARQELEASDLAAWLAQD